MDRLALAWNFHCGQDGIDLECEKIDFDLEFTLWTGWH